MFDALLRVIPAVAIIVIGELLLRKIIEKIMERTSIIAGGDEAEEAQKEERKERAHKLRNVVWMSGKAIIYVTALIFVLDAFHVNTAALVVSAGVAGFTAGFVLKNIFVWSLILSEDQFRIGEDIEINVPNPRGKADRIGMWTTRLRAPDGKMYHVPNSLIGTVLNHSWSERERRKKPA